MLSKYLFDKQMNERRDNKCQLEYDDQFCQQTGRVRVPNYATLFSGIFHKIQDCIHFTQH